MADEPLLIEIQLTQTEAYNDAAISDGAFRN